MKLNKTTLWFLWVAQLLTIIASIKLLLANTISALWLIVVLFFGLFVLGLFIYDMTKNEKLNQDQKIFWIFFMLFFFTIASPLYLLIIKEKN